jgi:hypothetical protein
LSGVVGFALLSGFGLGRARFLDNVELKKVGAVFLAQAENHVLRLAAGNPVTKH